MQLTSHFVTEEAQLLLTNQRDASLFLQLFGLRSRKFETQESCASAHCTEHCAKRRQRIQVIGCESLIKVETNSGYTIIVRFQFPTLA